MKSKQSTIVYTPEASEAHSTIKKAMAGKPCLDSVRRTEYGLTLQRLGIDDETVSKIKTCGTQFHAHFCFDCASVSYMQMHCKLRLCPDCAARTQKTRIAILSQIPGDNLKWITLTRKPEPGEDLQTAVDAIQNAFRRLRRKKDVRGLFKGGYAQIECKPRTDWTWHVHIHILAQGKYFPHKKLIQAWREALQVKYDPSVRINAVSAKTIARYISKYATKPQEIELMSQEQAQEFANLKKRLWLAWGNIKELLNKKPENGGCPRCGGHLQAWFTMDSETQGFCFANYKNTIRIDQEEDKWQQSLNLI